MHVRRIVVMLVLAGGLSSAGCAGRQKCAPSDPARVRETVQLALRQPFDPPTAVNPPPTTPANVLAISGGGMYGAYTAGFLAGWTQTGTRPKFDVVTGVSTGSLIATVAFLGSEFDSATREFYTAIKASDIYTPRSWILVPVRGSVASSDPLKRLITSVVEEKLLARVAAEHRRGRRLYVGTTNLETRKLVVWDMGSIAERGESGLELFRTVLLASCSVPGMLPAVSISDPVGGKPLHELHADGGVTAPLFLPPNALASKPDGTPSGTNVHLMISGKLFTDPAPVRPRILPVLNASAAGILYAHCRAEVSTIFYQTKLAGGNFFLTALPDSDNGMTLGLDFDPAEMARLYDVGFYHGVGGPAWMTAPPFENAVTDPPRR
jgi:hypothetical protein